MTGPDIVIREVGPRDGLQRESPLEPVRRLELVAALAASGIRSMEVAAFVSERAVPAMAGAAEVVAGLPGHTACTWWALVPNTVGADRALAAGIEHLSVTVSSSETYSRRNVGMSVDESVAQAIAIAGRAPAVDVVISCAFGSPYEAEIAPEAVAALTARLQDAGATVTLADTTGVATPRRLRRVLELTEPTRLGLHLHDTRGSALTNAYAALEEGVARFDTSVGGLGGSPFSDDAGGNLATEDLVYLLDDLGLSTGIDLDRLLGADDLLEGWIGRPVPGRVAVAERRRRHPAS